MSRLIPRVLFFLFGLAPLVGVRSAAAQAPGCTEGPWTEVVTREDITAHGLTRLSDLLAMSTDWYGTSVDGFTWSVRPSGTVPESPRWRVYIDGVPVAARLLGRTQLNALPIALRDIACVELRAAPGTALTTTVDQAEIRIYSREPEYGLSLEASASAANETGDPGPFRYTEEGGTNVDRIGPLLAVGAAVGASTWEGVASARSDEFHVTDAAVINRTSRAWTVDSKPRIRTRSIGASVSIGPDDRRHRLVAGATTMRDLPFFESVGVELPATHDLLTAGASGRTNFSIGHLRYAASISRSSFSRITGSESTHLDWKQDLAEVEVEAHLGSVRLSGGLRAADVRTETHLATPQVTTTRLAAGLRRNRPGNPRRSGSPAGYELLVEWKQRDAQRSLGLRARSNIGLRDRSLLRLVFSHAHLLPDEQDLWMWIDRGYRLPRGGTVHFAATDEADLPLQTAVDAAVVLSRGPNVTLTLKGFYRRVQNDHLSVFDRIFDPQTRGFVVETTITDDISGSSAGGSLTFRQTFGTRYRHTLSYVLEEVLTGDDAYVDALANVPRHRAGYRGTYSPMDRFSLSFRVRATSVSRWPLHRDAVAASRSVSEGPEPVHYVSELPSRVQVDVTAAKKMWRDHVSLSLGLQNVFDRPIRYHPAGAEFRMALHFSVSLHASSTEGF